MNKVVSLDFHGSGMSFRSDGWFDATAAGKRFGKRPIDWLSLQSTREYLSELKDELEISEDSSLIQARRNSGTWFAPELAVPYARWCNVRFGIWCDHQIRALLSGSHPAIDWQRCRSEAASSHKVMATALRVARERNGKETASYHYMNESKLVNDVVLGSRKGADRNAMDEPTLRALAGAEILNTVLIAQGMPYAERKLELQRGCTRKIGAKVAA